MININRVVLLGNLTRDPEVRLTPSGYTITTFSMALNSREKNGEEWVDRVDYFDVKAFGSMAEACGSYLAKGHPVAVEGRLRLEQWQAKDGTSRRKVIVNATNVQFLKSRDGASGVSGDDDWRDAAPADDFGSF